MDKCLVLNKIQFNETVVNFFQQNKNEIIQGWTMYPTLFDILNKFNISHEYYKDNVATPVYEYFMTIVNGENEPGDCPVMRKVIDIFYEKGFKVEDVFLSCTAFKNVLNSTLYEKNIEKTMIINLMMILDANLSSIIAIYSQKLEEKEDLITKHNQIIENHVLLTITDVDGKINHVTDAFCKLCGYDEEYLLGKSHKVIGDPEESPEFFKKMWGKISKGKKWQGKIKNFTKNGDAFIVDTQIIPVTDDQGKIVEYMAIRENITDKELFRYDDLTKVYTRRVFDEKLNLLLEDAITKQHKFAVILGDIDYFKKVNDNYGHDKGDEILKKFTKIIENNIRHNDMCFRWGGEEFIILLPFAKIEVAKNVAERIRVEFSETIHIENNYQSASFGITEFLENDSQESIFKRADKALYKAKNNGRNQVQVI